jgi:hypothetical protein
MKILRLMVVLLLLWSVEADAAFQGLYQAARSMAMGATGVAGYDDASILFINPAGLTSYMLTTVYGEYSKSGEWCGCDRWRFAAVVARGNSSFGVGWYQWDPREERKDENYSIAFGRRVMEGATGTYISIGGRLCYGRVIEEGLKEYGGVRRSDSNINGSLGIIIRPLPVISFGYTIENIRETDLQLSGGSESWGKINRWGFAYYWENRVTISYQRENRGGKVSNHYGFSGITALPLKIMAGFAGGDVYGGIGWEIGDYRGVFSFSPGEEREVDVNISLECLFGRMEQEIAE